MAVKPSSRLILWDFHCVRLMGVFPPDIPVFPFIPWDVWNWNRSLLPFLRSDPPPPLPPPPPPPRHYLEDSQNRSSESQDYPTSTHSSTKQQNSCQRVTSSDLCTTRPPTVYAKFIQSNWSLLQSRTELAKIFSQPPLIAYKRPLHYM